ncbi:beta/gamma crystallin domain-containing protein [Streptomyces sp. NPDC006739]|uniref:beta/gamma crystallin domain-containing protein n=1 Tax=Streptomyces sp. NPDC006739 TaxID=3364763 RepID=UPI0036B4A450
MKYSVKRVVLSALTTLVAAGSLTVAATSSASAIDEVECGPSDYLSLELHNTFGHWWTDCFANAGTTMTSGSWVTQISTGNNVVQWYGDGRWQPDQPIGKWTTYIWPNNPGGVNISEVQIF